VAPHAAVLGAQLAFFKGFAYVPGDMYDSDGESKEEVPFPLVVADLLVKICAPEAAAQMLQGPLADVLLDKKGRDLRGRRLEALPVELFAESARRAVAVLRGGAGKQRMQWAVSALELWMCDGKEQQLSAANITPAWHA
jgi:hypothetical protein